MAYTGRFRAASFPPEEGAFDPGILPVTENPSGAPGPRLAFLGDSITDFSEPYPYYVALLSGGQLVMHQRAFQAGGTSAAILANRLTDVTEAETKANACVILWGSNDAQASVALADFAANTQSAVAALRTAGIVPVLCTVPPLDNDAHALFGARYNAWLKRYALDQRLVLIDMHRALVDAATGDWKDGYAIEDGVHPTSVATREMGRVAAEVLSPLVPAQPLPVQPYRTADNLLTNTNFLVDTNADGIPDGYWAAGGVTPTLEADAEGFRWMELTVAAAAELTVNSDEIPSGAAWSAGDTLLYAARIASEQSGADTGLKTQVTFYTSAYSVVTNTILPIPTINGTTQQLAAGVTKGEIVCPAGGADRIIVSFVGGPGNGVYRFAQPTLLNLTVHG